MLIEVNDLRVAYGNRLVVHGVSIAIDEGEIVALIGHNGAGKTTSLKAIFGVLKPIAGQVRYNNEVITGRAAMANVKDGITFIPQEHFVFPGLSVIENLELGGYTIGDKDEVRSRLGVVYDLFPVLKQRQKQNAATLSGGERRMLGLGMALLTKPKLLFLDEPSLGLAPLFVQSMMETLQQVRDRLGTAILLVEQNVRQALEVSQRAYVMKMGRVILDQNSSALLKRGEWWDLF